jgi:hypothetical protein
MGTLKRLVSSPYLNLLVALVLLYSGLSEAWHDFQEIGEYRFGVHHGIVLYSLLQIAKVLPELFDGMAHLTEVSEPE